MYPFFYLEVGGFKFFQPQNKYKGFTETVWESRSGFRIRSVTHPATDGINLWLNGDDRTRSFIFLKMNNSLAIDELRKINQRSNNV